MIEVRILNSADEIESACALLYKEYIEVGRWQFSDNNPSELKVITRDNKKLLVDRITPHAIWFGAFDMGNLIGCIRLFKSKNNMMFEIEEYPTAKGIVEQYIEVNKPNIYEGSRACVSSEYKGKGVLLKLYLNILEYVERAQAAIFGSASNEYIKSVLKRIEWPCKKEDAFKFEETDSAPVNFYLADYKSGEVTKTIENIHLLERRRNRNSVNVLDALNIVAPIFPAPIYWHDIKGVVLGMNSLCLKAMGKEIDEVLGKTPYDFYPKKIADYIWQHSERVIKSGEVSSQEEYAYDDKGEPIGTYLAIKSPLYDEGGNVIGIVGTSVDITAQKEAERLKLQNAMNEEKLASQEIFKNCINKMVNMLHSVQIELTNVNGISVSTTSEDGYITLTKREQDILYLLSLNKSPKEIANILSNRENKNIQSDTIRSMISKQLYTKFGVYNVNQLIEKARILNLIPFIPDNFLDRDSLSNKPKFSSISLED
ncbi:MAG: PAS domain-containing protein [Neisseriaceae bacterium]